MIIKTAIIGCGDVVSSYGAETSAHPLNHIDALNDNKNFDIVGISDNDARKLALIQDKFQIKNAYQSYKDLALNHDIDLAVHSHKDLETAQPKGLKVAAVSDRENPCELLLMNKSAHNPNAPWELKKKAIVGTSSARRKSQLLAIRSDVEIKDLRGNVPTRVAKLKSGQYDAILIAKAGALRLNLDLSDLISLDLTPDEFVPAPAQGVLALQIRTQDEELDEILQKINDHQIQKLVGLNFFLQSHYKTEK